MSDDGDVIDIERARERRRSGELPPTLRQGVIVRRGIGLGEGLCLHRETIVDTQARIVRCRSCDADLDAMDVLGQVAREWEQLAHAIRERERLTSEITELRAEETRVKARVRNARRRANEVARAGAESMRRRAVEVCLDERHWLAGMSPSRGVEARGLADAIAALPPVEPEE